MTLQDIKDLPIDKIRADPCMLFLWVTFPLLQEGLDVMRSWGFKHITVGFTWVKTNSNGSPFFGVGSYTKSNAEICLLGGYGRIHKLVKNNTVSSVILSKKTKHSEKPHIVRDKIVKLVGDIPRIELFARHKVKGWDAWGNEVPKATLDTFVSNATLTIPMY